MSVVPSAIIALSCYSEVARDCARTSCRQYTGGNRATALRATDINCATLTQGNRHHVGRNSLSQRINVTDIGDLGTGWGRKRSRRTVLEGTWVHSVELP